MENGGFGANDIITGRGLGIAGFGYPGYGYGGSYGSFATPAANAVRLNRNEDVTRDQNMCTREVISSDVEGFRNTLDALGRANADATTRKEISDGFGVVNDRFLQDAVLGGQNRVEAARIAGDNRVELADRLADMRAESAKCCCETQKLIIQENSATREKMDQNLIAQLNRELADAKNMVSDDRVIKANDDAIQRQTATILAHLGPLNGPVCR